MGIISFIFTLMVLLINYIIIILDIKVNDKLEVRTLLGVMGNTGKVFGAHNHLAFAKSDDSGNRINRDNGYFGYINPLPILEG